MKKELQIAGYRRVSIFSRIKYKFFPNQVLALMCVISLAWIITFDVVFKDASEWFSGANDIVKLLSAISLSVISGYFFYLITVIFPNYDKKKKQALFFYYQVVKIQWVVECIFQNKNTVNPLMASKGKYYFEDYARFEDKDEFKEINIFEPHYDIYEHEESTFEFIERKRIEIRNYIIEVERFSFEINYDFHSALRRLEDSILFFRFNEVLQEKRKDNLLDEYQY